MKHHGETDWVISAGESNRIIERKHHGYQPLGIACTWIHRTLAVVAVADYFAPAVELLEVTIDGPMIHFKSQWMHGVIMPDGKRERIFPERTGRFPRCQTVNFDAEEGHLWVSQNGGREFFRIARPTQGEERGRLIDSLILPPATDKVQRVVHSALLQGNDLITIEATPDAKNWVLVRYFYEDGCFSPERQEPMTLAPFLYGVGRLDGDCALWTVTDFRIEGMTPGLYSSRGVEPVLSPCYGNGICFLPNRAALLTRYGQRDARGPGKGQPGALIYIPTELLIQ